MATASTSWIITAACATMATAVGIAMSTWTNALLIPALVTNVWMVFFHTTVSAMTDTLDSIAPPKSMSVVQIRVCLGRAKMAQARTLVCAIAVLLVRTARRTRTNAARIRVNTENASTI